jgi:hypothetical protein
MTVPECQAVTAVSAMGTWDPFPGW